MKFKSALLTSASGSIGGMTASRNPGGLYLRSRVIPTNPSTPLQADVRLALAELAADWTTNLTAANRLSWKTFAKNVPVKNSLGDNIIISALAWYIKANAPRVRLGSTAPVVNSAPTIFALALLTQPFDVIPGAVANEIEFTIDPTDPWASAIGGRLYVYVSAPQNKTINFFKGPFAFNSEITGAATPISPIRTIILAQNVVAGQRVFVRFAASNTDGRPSTDVIIPVDF